MILDVQSRIGHDPTLNSIKEKTSIAFLMGLNSTVNYAMNDASKDFDGLGIDYTAINRTIGPGRTVATPTDEINIQLKGVSTASESVLKVTPTHIEYKLGKSLQAVGNHYLFVVVLPHPEELLDWCGIDEEKLVLKAVGYYYKVEGTLSAGVVKIPRSNQLTAEAYMDLFENVMPVEVV